MSQYFGDFRPIDIRAACVRKSNRMLCRPVREHLVCAALALAALPAFAQSQRCEELSRLSVAEDVGESEPAGLPEAAATAQSAHESEAEAEPSE